MAKIKYSALVSDMRNKLNGSVASKNRYGSYLRNKVTPVNPQTEFQQVARQRLGAFSSQYRGLTQAQRNSWINGAQNFPFTDIFGDIRYLSGQVLFVKLNINLDNVGGNPIDEAPLPAGVPELIVEAVLPTSADGVLTGLSVALSAQEVPEGFALAVYATPPLPASINFVKNRYRFLGTGLVLAGVSSIIDDYTDRFGSSVNDGERIHVRVALVSTTTGQQGVPSGAIGTIADA